MTEINFGFLLVPLQLLDLAGPMDVVGNISLDNVKKYGSAELARTAPTINCFHIGPTLEPVLTTSSFLAQPTTTIQTCPRLDYLMVGGPSPEYCQDLPADMKQFIKERVPELKGLFTGCTGALVAAAAGVLDGHRATVNHSFISYGYTIAPKVDWTAEKNWVVDGKFWTAAGAVAGMDMLAHWIRTEFGTDLLNLSTKLLEYQPRDEDGKPLMFMNGRGEIVKV